MIGFCSWLSTRRHHGVGFASGSAFAPTAASLSAATPDVIPTSISWVNAAVDPAGTEVSVGVVVAMTDPSCSSSTSSAS